jgi:hypothetical protein
LLNTLVVPVAIEKTPEILGRWLNGFITQVEPDDTDERLNRALADRYVSVRPDLDGISFLHAAISSVDAVAVDQLLNAVASIVEPGDNRTQQQRRADTLVDLLCGRISNGWHPEFDTNSDTDDHLDDDPPHTPPHDQDPPDQDLPDAENHRRNSDDNDRRQGDGTHRGGAEGTDGIRCNPTNDANETEHISYDTAANVTASGVNVPGGVGADVTPTCLTLPDRVTSAVPTDHATQVCDHRGAGDAPRERPDQNQPDPDQDRPDQDRPDQDRPDQDRHAQDWDAQDWDAQDWDAQDWDAQDWELPASAFRPDPHDPAPESDPAPGSTPDPALGSRPRPTPARTTTPPGIGPLRPPAVTIGVVITARSLFGDSNMPGQLIDRSAQVPADTVRDLAHRPGTLFYRLLTDDAGKLLDVTELGRFPSRKLGLAVAFRDGTCGHPGCHRPATACDLDHLVPAPLGPTSAANLGPKCRNDHRCKTHAGHSTTRNGDLTAWTTPTGHTYATHDQPFPVDPWPDTG